MAKYLLTPRAEADRDRIVKDGLPEWGRQQVATYLDDLQRCPQRLADFPMLGEACEDVRPGYRRIPFGAHHVYYRVEKAGVLIVRIRSQRMLPRKSTLDEGGANP